MDGSREVAARWPEAYNSHQESQLRAVLAPNARLTGPNGIFEGAAAITDYMMAWVDAFGPHSGYTVKHVTVDGDTVVMEMVWQGTHLGTLADPGGDIPPTNKRVEARTSHAVVVEHGVVKEVRMYFDVFDFLSQLGLIPAPATAG